MTKGPELMERKFAQSRGNLADFSHGVSVEFVRFEVRDDGEDVWDGYSGCDG